MDQRIPDGTIVEFTYYDDVGLISNLWKDGLFIGCGKIVNYSSYDDYYEIQIIEPAKLQGRFFCLCSQAFRVAGSNTTPVILQPTTHSSKTIRPEDVEHQKQMNFFAKRHDENFGNCSVCGSELKALMRTTFCPKCEV